MKYHKILISLLLLAIFGFCSVSSFKLRNNKVSFLSENEKIDTAIEEEKNLDNLEGQIENAIEKEDLNFDENHPSNVNSDHLNNDAEEEEAEIQNALQSQNGEEHHEDNEDLEVD